MDSSSVGRDEIAAAAKRIGGRVRCTPVIGATAAELGVPVDVTLKLELLQHTGSFKPRGAFNRVLAAIEAGDVPPAGLVAASGGNHGAAVAHVAAELGLTAEVFVPATSPATKRDRIAALGATVHVIDGYYDDAQAAANERRTVTGALLVHPYDHPAIVAGQGTMAYELDAQVDGYDTLVVATGGGGFVAGQAAWLEDRRRVVSVEPATSRCLQAALAAGAPTPVEVRGLAADSLGARQLGDVAWAVVRRYVDEAVVVDDDDIRAAQRVLWER
ncbi:MAG: pyridoxal-phosphate dependent enzyme, partial [Acidimicrobiia bacterium]|nr:pyridoxal-phosphate dependent enzyme [Acidimicrobiia bacterium]